MDKRSLTSDCNVSCWNADGLLLWQRSFAGMNGGIHPMSVAARRGGGVVVAGYMVCGRVLFEDQVLIRYPVYGRDAFAFVLDQNGNLSKSYVFTSQEGGNNRLSGLDVNDANDVALVRYFAGEMRTPTGKLLNSHGFDGYITVIQNHER